MKLPTLYIGLTMLMPLIGCANLGSEPTVPSTAAAMKQELLGRWYKPQTYVRGEERSAQQPAIEYRADGSCTYYLSSNDNPKIQTSRSHEAWPGHWRLKGTKLYRMWEPNWHYFAGRGPGDGEIVQLNSEEMKLKTEPFGALEHYYRHPHWQEIEPIELHPERKDPWD